MAGGNAFLNELRLAQNPVLTNLAIGYGNEEFIAEKIFPVIPVTAFPTLRVPVMNRDHLKIVSDVRTLYGDALESTNGGLSYTDVEMREHTQKKRIDIQELLNMGWGDLEAQRTYALVESQLLNIEKDTADILQTTGNYTHSNTAALVGTDQWTHASSHPETTIYNDMEVVRGNCGHMPNTMVLGAKAAWALQKNANMVIAIKGANSGGSVSLEQLASYFGLSNGVFVGKSVYDNSELITDAFAPVDLWSDNAILAYVATTPKDKRSMYIPSFGYTFRHKEFSPTVRKWEAQDGLTRWVQSTNIWVSKMYNDACAYLITDTNA